MEKIRVYELARELDTNSKRLMEKLAEVGIIVKNHMSLLEEDELNALYKHIGMKAKATDSVRADSARPQREPAKSTQNAAEHRQPGSEQGTQAAGTTGGASKGAAESQTARQSSEDRTAAGRPAAGQQTAGQAAADKSAVDRSAAGKPAVGRQATGQAAAERSAARQAVADKSAAEQSSTGKTEAERSAGGPVALDKSTAGPAASERSAAEKSEAEQHDKDQTAMGRTAAGATQGDAAARAGYAESPDQARQAPAADARRQAASPGDRQKPNAKPGAAAGARQDTAHGAKQGPGGKPGAHADATVKPGAHENAFDKAGAHADTTAKSGAHENAADKPGAHADTSVKPGAHDNAAVKPGAHDNAAVKPGAHKTQQRDGKDSTTAAKAPKDAKNAPRIIRTTEVNLDRSARDDRRETARQAPGGQAGSVREGGRGRREGGRDHDRDRRRRDYDRSEYFKAPDSNSGLIAGFTRMTREESMKQLLAEARAQQKRNAAAEKDRAQTKTEISGESDAAREEAAKIERAARLERLSRPDDGVSTAGAEAGEGAAGPGGHEALKDRGDAFGAEPGAEGYGDALTHGESGRGEAHERQVTGPEMQSAPGHGKDEAGAGRIDMPAGKEGAYDGKTGAGEEKPEKDTGKADAAAKKAGGRQASDEAAAQAAVADAAQGGQAAEAGAAAGRQTGKAEASADRHAAGQEAAPDRQAARQGAQGQQAGKTSAQAGQQDVGPGEAQGQQEGKTAAQAGQQAAAPGEAQGQLGGRRDAAPGQQGGRRDAAPGQQAGRRDAAQGQQAGKSGEAPGQQAGRMGAAQGQQAGRIGDAQGQQVGRRDAAPGQQAGRRDAAPGQQAGRRDAAPGQQTGRRDAAPGQQTGRRDAASGQQAFRRDAAGQQAGRRDAVPGQQAGRRDAPGQQAGRFGAQPRADGPRAQDGRSQPKASFDGRSYQQQGQARTGQGARRDDRPYQSGGDRPYQSGGDRPYQSRDGQFRPRDDRAGGQRSDRPYQSGGDRPYQPRDDRTGGQRSDRPYQSGGDRPFQPRSDRPFQSRDGARPSTSFGGARSGAGAASGDRRPPGARQRGTDSTKQEVFGKSDETGSLRNEQKREYSVRDTAKEAKKDMKRESAKPAPATPPKNKRFKPQTSIIGETKGVHAFTDDEFIINEFYDASDESKKSRRQQKLRRPLRKEKYIPPRAILTSVTIGESLTVKELAETLKKTAGEVIKKLMGLGMVATINDSLDFDTATLVAGEFSIATEREIVVNEEDILFDDAIEDMEELSARPPVVVVMGHVDHGKTSLLDAIRKTNVIASEAGGITQHIGAYMVNINGRAITFLDTPGHEAFTSMRARGAMVTDIAILVISAVDGVMPQTVEAINHAKAAKVSIIVAINMIDREGANPERVKQELTEYGIVVEEWGGDVIAVPVSAKTGENIGQLLEMVILTADLLELKSDPKRQAKGTVIEAKLDKSRGPVATLLVQRGTLRVGDTFITGATVGRIRAMLDDNGKNITEAGPSAPVEVIGLSEVPDAGEVFYVTTDEKVTKSLAEKRRLMIREEQLRSAPRVTLVDAFDFIRKGEIKELNVIIKADVQGSVEAVRQSIGKLGNEEVGVNIIHSGVGAITESDVSLADVSNAIIIGFNVRPGGASVIEAAELIGIDIRLYTVIYNAIEDIQAALKGMLDPTFREVVLGHVEVRQIFRASGVGTIGGCYVLDGKIQRGNNIRILRDGVAIHDGKLASLRRFKDDAREVMQGFECGVSIDRFNDIKENDIIEPYMMEEIPVV